MPSKPPIPRHPHPMPPRHPYPSIAGTLATLATFALALALAFTLATPALALTLTRGETTQGSLIIITASSPASQVTLTTATTNDASPTTTNNDASTSTNPSQILPLAANAQLVLGFAPDATAPLTLRETRPDGSHRTLTLTPTPRHYETQRIDGLPSQYVTPPPETLARIKADNRAVGTARQITSRLTAWQEEFIWPCHGIITGVYGSRRILNGKPRSPHYGIDIAAPQGTPVKAPASGEITLIADLYYTGHTIIMDHGHGVSSTFLHLDEVAVAEGQAVKQGEVIGSVGSSGRSTGAHLDWRVNWHATRLDPMLLVPPMPYTN